MARINVYCSIPFFFVFFSAPTWMNNLDDEVYTTTPFWKVVVLAPPVKREKWPFYTQQIEKRAGALARVLRYIRLSTACRRPVIHGGRPKRTKCQSPWKIYFLRKVFFLYTHAQTKFAYTSNKEKTKEKNVTLNIAGQMISNGHVRSSPCTQTTPPPPPPKKKKSEGL
jgi:hypothetical protein